MKVISLFKKNLKERSKVLKSKVFKVLVKVISKQKSKMVFKGFEVQFFFEVLVKVIYLNI